MTGIPETIPVYSLYPSRTIRDDLDVTTDSPIINLPLRTLGLPGQVLEWLLDAGIPAAPLERSAIRQGVGPDQGGRALLLFDSRNASARIDAEAAESLGYETIDAARLFSSRRPLDNADRTVLIPAEPRRRFLDGLRSAFEDAGGLWLRLADFPHPYRAVLCENATPAAQAAIMADPVMARVLNAFVELPADATRSGRVAKCDWLQACQAAGHPVRTATTLETLRAQGDVAVAAAPLTWRASLETFAEWWRWRASLSLAAVRHARTTELTMAVPRHVRFAQTWQPAVEIWRGRHCAILPVRAGTITIHDEAIPFQLQHHRPHAGFLADETDIGSFRDKVSPLTAAS